MINLESIVIDPPVTAQGSIIWLHGLGADGNDFVSIVEELRDEKIPPLRYIFPHAPMRPVTINNGYVMRAWYDIFSLDRFMQEDIAGINDSAKSIATLIEKEIARGISSEHIILAGFSQGGALALHSGLRYQQPLGGIIALSSYLPLAAALPSVNNPVNKNIPIFMAHGNFDSVVPYQFAYACKELLKTNDYQVDWHTYPMEHSLCFEEILAMRNWLTHTCSTF